MKKKHFKRERKWEKGVILPLKYMIGCLFENSVANMLSHRDLMKQHVIIRTKKYGMALHFFFFKPWVLFMNFFKRKCASLFCVGHDAIFRNLTLQC